MNTVFSATTATSAPGSPTPTTATSDTAARARHGADNLEHQTRGEDPFFRRYGVQGLPRALRAEASGMGWQLFRSIYAPEPTLDIQPLGAERVDNLTSRHRFEITTTSKVIGPSHRIVQVEAPGPVAAATEALAAAGRAVEILEFHQIPIFNATATIVLGSHHNRRAWAIGFGPEHASSSARALASAAERLHG